MKYTKRIRLRSLVLGGFFFLCIAVILIRLFWIQVINYEFYEEHNNKTWAYTVELPAQRGDIVDRNGKVLAASAPSYHVVLHPRIVRQKKEEAYVARELSRLLGAPESNLLELISRDKGQVEIHPYGRSLPYDRLEEFKKAFGNHREQGQDIVFYGYGVRLQRDAKRYYPYNELASHTLGYVDREGKAVMGIEATFEKDLAGKDGSLKGQRDRWGYPLPHVKPEVVQPVDGQRVQLTIDMDIQQILEDAMQETVQKWNPKFAIGYVMDPKTMEILAMSSAPTFNPNTYNKSDPITDMKNNALYSRFEPGSTFKLVTLAAAVEEKKFNPKADFRSGSIKVKGAPKPISDVKRGGWGDITYLEGVKKSSNVAFVKLGQMLGKDVFMKYADAFAMNGKTGIELGETAGIGQYERPVELATATFGQGVSINGLHMTTAYAAVANGGEWMTPQIVKGIGPDNNRDGLEIERRRVISAQSAKQVTEILEEVVLDGTGQVAQIPGIRVAGKTGTAQRVVGGEYSEDTWLVSFVGYAPAEDPRFVIGIFVDDPQMGGDYTLAGQVAMPAFKTTMERSLKLRGVTPSEDKMIAVQKRHQRKMPDVTKKSVKEAVPVIQAEGMKIHKFGQGDTVLKQYPSSNSSLSKGMTVYILTDKPENIPTPDFKGQALRDALAISSFLGIRVQVEGEGYVMEQTKLSAEGEPVELILKLGPRTEVAGTPDSG